MTLPGGGSVVRGPGESGPVTTERTIPQQRLSSVLTAGDRKLLGGRAATRWRPGPAWMAAVPAVVTLLVVCWQIQRPSYWRDEGATLSAVTRPPGALVRMLAHADAVHQ